MEDKTLNHLQRYLTYIRYNSTNFGLRLLKPFKVCNYSLVNNKYTAIFDNNNINDCYYIEKNVLEKFLRGEFSNNINLTLGRAFQESKGSGFYISLELNKLELDFETIELLFGLRFKKNDIFYKIQDVAYQKLKLLDEEVIDDNIKIYIIEDFHAEDFLEVNKFLDTSKTAIKGVGYSIEYDEEGQKEYVALADAKIAIEMSKKDSYEDILKELNVIFPFEHKLGDKIKEILKNNLT